MEQKRKRGRPPGKTTPVQINVYVSEQDVVTIDKARGPISRSAYMRIAAVVQARAEEHQTKQGTRQ